MSRDLELPDTELTVLESIRNLLRAWFHHLAHADFTGNHGPDRFMRRDFDERMTALDWPVVPREIGAGRVVPVASPAI